MWTMHVCRHWTPKEDLLVLALDYCACMHKTKWWHVDLLRKNVGNQNAIHLKPTDVYIVFSVR